MNQSSLTRHFRVTGFADILGWSSVTEGIDTLVLRKLSRREPLDAAESALVAYLDQRVALATKLDNEVGSIVRELRAFATPIGEMNGAHDAAHFWENRHVTFARFSDNIFVHSTSWTWTVLFMAELLKRGLERGVLFRAGLSCGVAVHREVERSSGVDARSRDISLFGDGVTTAVAAERAGAGRGVRVFVHRRLEALLGNDYSALLRPISTGNADVAAEFMWWADLTAICNDRKEAGLVTECNATWRKKICAMLEADKMYDWNRKSKDGLVRLQDTIDVLAHP